VDKAECFRTENLTKEELIAIKNTYAGEATPTQQTLALSVIVAKLCRTHHLQYVPGSQDQSSFIAGRAFVGDKLLYIIKQSKPGQLGNNNEKI